MFRKILKIQKQVKTHKSYNIVLSINKYLLQYVIFESLEKCADYHNVSLEY